MSQYPYGFGFPGQQPQSQYLHPYHDYGSYSAPGYGAQQPQQPQQPPPTSANYYAATQSAYDYNANSIPGLGTPPTVPLFPVPFNGDWDQNGYARNAPPAQYTPYIPTLPLPTYADNLDRAPVSPPPAPPPHYRQNQPKVQTKVQRTERLAEQSKQQLREVDSQEEGEISDGQFDDLYDDASNQPSGPQPLAAASASASAKSSEDGVASATDQEPNFYDTDLDDLSAPNNQSTVPLRGKALESGEGPRQAEAPRTERDHSRSYSPYLSPRELEQDTSTTGSSAINNQAGHEIKQQLPHRGANVETTTGDNRDAREHVNGTDRSEEGEVVPNGLTTTLASPRPFGTLPEAQNEAKKTILRLLPLGVKYQTYIDEGIDEKVVKDLFIQLNLAPPARSSAPPEKPHTTQEKETHDAKPQPTEASEVDARAKKQEERKDKIARLLAEKKAKAAAGATKEPKETVAPVAAATSSPSVKPKTQSEKNLLLQQKMEALRKAQEARLQKASQQSASPQVSRPEVVEKGVTRPPAQGPTVTTQPTTTESKSTAAARPSPVALALSHDGPVASPVHPAQRIQSPALPGFANKQVNQRKRPVAADFVDYPTQAVKRPFLPTRQDSSLVISVSDDDEDDDDDVDMEMDSAAEDSPASAQQSFSVPRRAPSLRDYPPLTNRGAPRQTSSPASGTPGGRAANVDLEAQERAIADLKRKIEEAEARKKAKPKTGSSTPQTPSAGDVTPIDQGIKASARRAISTGEMDDKNGPSAQLLQEAEAAKSPKSPPVSHAEHRSRLSSAQSPSVKAIMDEKVARIKRIEEELSRLRAEVELAENQGSEEVEELGSDSAAGPVQDTQATDVDVTSNGERDRAQSDETSLDAASQSHPMEIDSSEKSDDDEMDTTPENPQVGASEVMETMAANGHRSSSHLERDVQSSVVEQPAEATAAIAQAILSGNVMSAAEEDASDDYEPPDAANDDHTPVDSPPFSPAPADDTGSPEANQREAQELIPPIPTMPTQISTAIMPNDDPATEAHAEFFAHPSSRVEEITREDSDEAASTMQTSFVDYESPLRYFRAYRFHPQYNDSVAGGFKSLTYSNRIDPRKEVCPDELDGHDCPRGSACQFQHFQTMAAPDNLIILELGSSEDLMGDQKKNFNNGLRELVASFQKSKVRDFKTIAEGIVEFRRRFLGDSTKILHLEGTTI
ncbi:hypothetical protein VMCG_02083 [Cytospora schulzeri]|uniref:C3H1-type domain-containing protein n=1 Tax=Cytospora schulzeri TaxID=448051 RepID=A0A423X4E4_9PEZI|nr:hypothetical protein VMCG_02083 [Valsa malicola]